MEENAKLFQALVSRVIDALELDLPMSDMIDIDGPVGRYRTIEESVSIKYSSDFKWCRISDTFKNYSYGEIASNNCMVLRYTINKLLSSDKQTYFIDITDDIIINIKSLLEMDDEEFELLVRLKE